MDALSIDDVDQIAQAVVELGWKIVCVDPGPFTDRVAVLRRGTLVEHGPTAAVFADPTTAYTRDLLAAVPRVTGARSTRTTEPEGAFQ